MDGTTAVRVFVDDAVHGRFPPTCARTGRPGDGWLSIDAAVTQAPGFSTLTTVLLVVFGGPIGWIVLLLLDPSHPSERLQVSVPWTLDTQDGIVALRRRRRWAWAGAGAGAVAALALAAAAGDGGGTMAGQVVLVAVVAATVAAAAVALAADRRIRQQRVEVELDASRRWVTLRNVHPAFAAAVRVDQQRRHQLAS